MKEIKDYLHFYLGCEVVQIYKGVAQKKRYTLTYSILGVCIHGVTEYKLLLRPLSDMTEEEKEIDNNIGDDKYVGGSFVSFNHQATRTAWLLKQGFDLFQLIESGLAIDKTKN